MTRVLIAVAAAALLSAAPAMSQTARYNTGDRVQCDLTRMNKWESGTVLSVHDEVWGTFYKVKIDGDSSDSWNCHPEYMRPAPAVAPAAAAPAPASARPAGTPPAAAPAPVAATAPAKPTAPKPSEAGGGGGGGGGG